MPSHGHQAGSGSESRGRRPGAACPFEPEVLRAVLAGGWPDGAEGDLRAHASGCRTCASLAKVASSLRAERDRMRGGIGLPAAGTVFWRAELRARQEAARNAARPVPLVVALGLAASAGLSIALFGSGLSWLRAWASWLLDLGPSMSLPAPAVSSLPAFVVAALAFAAALVVVPLAVLFSARDD